MEAPPALNTKASQLARQASKGAEIGKAGATTQESLPKEKQTRKWFMKDLPFSPSLKDSALVYISYLKDPVTFFLRAVEDEVNVQELQAEVVTHCSQGMLSLFSETTYI